MTTRQLIDDALAAEHQLERDLLVQEAMVKYQEFLAAKKAFDAAAARLIPLRTELDQVAA